MSPPIKPKLEDYYDYPEGIKDMRGTFSFTAKREPLFDFGEAIEKLTAQVKELEAYKADVENAVKMAMDEQCSLDQQHCTCVPLLRLKIKELLAEIAELRTEAIAVVHAAVYSPCNLEYILGKIEYLKQALKRR